MHIRRHGQSFSCILLIILCALSGPGTGFAENIVFPAVSGVVDITKPPYSADKTGKTDCSAILTQALNDERTSGNWGCGIVYLPNGTYLVKGPVSWKMPPYTVGPHLCGQSRKGTVIRLADSTYRSTTQSGVVIQTGGNVAQCFNRGLFNVTVNTGKGNPGAIGVFWYANNEALMSDVDIISGDGLGVAGLRVGTNEEGPAGVRRVYIQGFAYGVWSSANLNAMTLTQISLQGQRVCGVINEANLPLYIDSLTSVNSVPVISNRNKGVMVLINGSFSGGRADTVAIVNATGAMLFARNITTQGYKQAVSSTSHTVAPPAGMIIGEWSSHGAISLNSSPLHSLNLPIKRPPEPDWEQDLNKWASITSYTSGRTETQALQAAIDDPTKTVVVLPTKGKDYTINAPVYVRGNIRMIIGVGGGLALSGSGSLVIPDAAGSPFVVKIMKIQGANVPLVQQSGRTVILESIGNMQIRHEGTGDMFCTDITSALTVSNAQAHVWAWHYNDEGVNHKTLISAGTVWLFGWKYEYSGTSATFSGGTTEILGFYNYSGGAVPQFIISGAANVSIASMMKGMYGAGYNIIVQETRNGVTKQLLATNNPAGYPTNFDAPLFTAYDATRIERPRMVVPNGTPLRAWMYRGDGAMVFRAGDTQSGTSLPALGPGLYVVRIEARNGTLRAEPVVLPRPTKIDEMWNKIR
jgi:hypothetical protein